MGTTTGIGEVTVLCTRHKRKCIMAYRPTGTDTRIRHMSRIGTQAEVCDSVQFIVRREYETDRNTAESELTAIQRRERTE